MRTDVKTLLGALTTERNALNRAIAALELISEPVVTAPPADRWKTRPRRVSAAVRARLSLAMKAAHAKRKADGKPWSAYHQNKTADAAANANGAVVDVTQS